MNAKKIHPKYLLVLLIAYAVPIYCMFETKKQKEQTNKAVEAASRNLKREKALQLYNLAAAGNEKAFRLSIRRGANINGKFCDLPLLSEAIMRGNIRAAELLLRNGALVDVQDENMRTPLTFAAARGETRLVQLLLANSATVDHWDIFDRTALAYAVLHKYFDSAHVLLHWGANDKTKDFLGISIREYAMGQYPPQALTI